MHFRWLFIVTSIEDDVSVILAKSRTSALSRSSSAYQDLRRNSLSLNFFTASPILRTGDKSISASYYGGWLPQAFAQASAIALSCAQCTITPDIVLICPTHLAHSVSRHYMGKKNWLFSCKHYKGSHSWNQSISTSRTLLTLVLHGSNHGTSENLKLSPWIINVHYIGWVVSRWFDGAGVPLSMHAMS